VDMKNVLFILLVFSVLVGCKKELDSETSLSPLVNANYITYRDCDMVYFGDTIKYNIKFKSSKLIKYIDISYIDTNGNKVDLDISDFCFNPIRVDKYEDSILFQYPTYINYSPRWVLPTDDNSRKITLLVDYYDATGIIQTDTLPKFTFSYVNVVNHKRLYNIALKDGKIRGYSFIDGFTGCNFIPTVNCGGICDKIDDEKLFMVNIPNSDFDIYKDSAVTKDFIAGWYAPKGNHFFVKVTNDFKYYNDYIPMAPDFYLAIANNHLRGMYNQNDPKITKIENPKVGDLYAFRYVYPAQFLRKDIYGLIEVTHIENDYLTSENGGNENDYIEFRVKFSN